MHARIIVTAGVLALVVAGCTGPSETGGAAGDLTRDLALPPVDAAPMAVASPLEVDAPAPEEQAAPAAARRPRAARPVSAPQRTVQHDHSAEAAPAAPMGESRVHPKAADEVVASGPSAAATPAESSGRGGKPRPTDVAVRPEPRDLPGVPMGQIPGGDQWDDPMGAPGRGNGGPVIVRGGAGGADDPCDVHVTGGRGVRTPPPAPPPLINERMPRRGTRVSDRGPMTGPGLPRGGIRF